MGGMGDLIIHECIAIVVKLFYVYRYTYSDLLAWDSQIHDCGLGYLVVYVLYVCVHVCLSSVHMH